MPTADEIKANGIDPVAMFKTLLEKVEEQALYLFGLHDRIARLEAANGI